MTVRDAWDVPRQTRTYIVEHLLSGPFPHVRQLMLRRYCKFVRGLVMSTNPIISALSHWGIRTRLSTTGSNVANIKEEFSVDPLKCKPMDISVMKRNIPENGEQNMELIERLLNIRADEIEPDVVDEINELISNICEQ